MYGLLTSPRRISTFGAVGCLLAAGWLTLGAGDTTTAGVLAALGAAGVLTRAYLDGLLDDVGVVLQRGYESAQTARQSMQLPTRQTLALVFTVLMVGFAFAPFMGGFGGIVPQDHDGVASANEDEPEEIMQFSGTDDSGPVSVTDDSTYSAVDSSDAVVVGVDDNGEEMFTQTLDDSIVTDMAYSDGKLHAVSYDSGLNVIDPETGDIIHESMLDGNVAVDADGDKVALIDDDSNELIYADWEKDDVLWDYSYDVNHNEVEMTDESVYSHGSPFGDITVTKIDRETGEHEWNRQLGDGSDTDGDVVYNEKHDTVVANIDSDVHLLDPSDGSTIDTFSVGISGPVTKMDTSGDLVLITPEDSSETYLGMYDLEENQIVWEDTIQPYGVEFTDDTSEFGVTDENNLLRYQTNMGYGGEEVTGQVTDQNGDPVEGATVTAEDSEVDSVTTDSAGEYELTVPEEGEYTVEATADGYTEDSQTVNVPEDGLEGVDFSLRNIGSYTVFGPDGGPIDGDRDVTLSLYDASEHTDPHLQPTSYWTDGDIEPDKTANSHVIDFEGLDLDGEYVMTIETDDTDADDYYPDSSVYVSIMDADWEIWTYPEESVEVPIEVRDDSGEWPVDGIELTASVVENGDRTTNARTRLDDNGVGLMELQHNLTYDIFAERDHDGAQRYLGELNALPRDDGDAVVFEITAPEDEYDEVFGDDPPESGPHQDPWEDESDIAYPPVVTSSASPNDPVADETVTFSASPRVFGDAAVDSIEWELPDGTTATGESVTWTPSADDAGSAHVAHVTVTDTEELTATAQTSVYVAETVEERAHPPAADIEVLTDSPTAGELVTLESIVDVADGVDVRSVEWDLTGNDEFSDATGERAELTPESSGIHQAGVRVTDSNGVEDIYYVAFFVGAEESSATAPGSSGGFAGGTGVEGDGGVPASAPAMLGLTSLIGMFAYNRRTGAVPRSAFAGVGGATAVAAVAPGTVSAAVGAIPTVGWTAIAAGAVAFVANRAGYTMDDLRRS